MAEVINLRLARKARKRDAAARQAQANRALHGEPKALRAVREAEAARAARQHDATKREDD
ncbi:MAG: hypothetical protein RIQ99_1593 [Pseudomonadota bacterium]